MLLHESFEYNVTLNHNKIALIFEGKQYTYGEINNSANSLANALIENGLRKQDRVAIFLGNAPETVISIYGTLKAGGIFVTLNPQIKANKLSYILNDCHVKIVITDVPGIAALANNPQIQMIIVINSQDNIIPQSSEKLTYLNFDDIIRTSPPTKPQQYSIDIDLASLVYTSGSTGRPKGVMLTHLNMLTAARSIIQYLQHTSDDVIIDMLPLSFDYGLYQIIMAFMFGGTVVLERSFLYPYQIMETMMKWKVTGLPLVPTIAAMLLTLRNLNSKNVPALRYISSTGQVLPPAHISRLREAFPQIKIFSMYGLTECKRVAYLPPEEIDRRPTSVGKAIPNTETFIIDENGQPITTPWTIGQLVVRGSHVMAGYWGLPEKSAESLRPGFYPNEKVLYTGDLFQQDEEGFLYFISRLDDMFKCGGQFVSPKEIENVLDGYEGIVEAAVIGVDDKLMGKKPVAFVILAEGSRINENDILSYCSQHLEKHMVPKRVIVNKTLPKTPTGKILKSDLNVPNEGESNGI